MTATMNPGVNGKARKTLASQLDRLDGILDALSDGLNQAVATVVEQAVMAAVREGVQAAVTEVLTNPDLRRHVREAASPAHAPAPPAPAGPGWLARLAVVATVAGGKAAAALRQVGARLKEAAGHCLAAARGKAAAAGCGLAVGIRNVTV